MIYSGHVLTNDSVVVSRETYSFLYLSRISDFVLVTLMVIGLEA